MARWEIRVDYGPEQFVWEVADEDIENEEMAIADFFDNMEIRADRIGDN